MSSSTTTSTVWSVATRVHNETGFWGPVDAVHQFCEPHYSTTFYLAEAWNATSSIIFLIAAWYSYQNMIKQGKSSTWVIMGCVWLGIIGVGSCLFHGTMRRSMQYLDEGPMVIYAGTCMLWKLDKHQLTRHRALTYRVMLGFLYVAVLWIYAWLDWYEFFVHGFTCLALLDAGFSYSWKEGDLVARDIALVLIILGKVLWEIENRLCESYPMVWVLHVGWHVLSASSAYSGMVYNASLIDLEAKKPKLQ